MSVAEELTSIVAKIAELAVGDPTDPVCIHVAPDGTERAMGWGELHRRSSQLAGAMADRGVQHGDLVSIAFRNSPEFVLATVAAWKVGATPVPVRWDLPDWELARLHEVIDAHLALGEDDLDWIRATEDAPVPELPDVIAPSLQGICSSGSTGTPKIILSAMPAVFNPLYAMPLVEMWRRVPRPQTLLALAPMYHVNAFATLQALIAGDRLIVLEKFDAALVGGLIERHGVTTFTATPTMLQRIADQPDIDDRDLSSLEYFIQGAAPMPPSLVRRWIDLVGAEKIVMAYGMTEAIGITALLGTEWLEHEGSVGRGIKETRVRILDDEGNELPPGEIGEVYLLSPSYGGSTYLGEAPQLPTTDDGYQTVGDMGYVDDDGFLYIVDRRVDMIITGGANVFPAEVEAALGDHPAIADVVVVGLRDPEWGRRVHAIVEPADPENPPDEAAVIAYAKDRLAAYKVPKTVELIDRIPRSAATKVNRGRLIEARGG